MDGASTAINFAVQDLNDLELATLLCLITNQHCIVSTDPNDHANVAQELETIAHRIFGLSCATIDCDGGLSMEDFGRGVLTAETDDQAPEDQQTRNLALPSFSKVRSSEGYIPSLDKFRISNIVVARNLNHAPEQVQIQALELIRSKRIYTRTAVHTAPKHFLLIALLSDDEPLDPHLNDHFFISHTYDSEVAPQSSSASINDEASSVSSVIHTPQFNKEPVTPVVSREDLLLLTGLAKETSMSAEIRAYLHNVGAFLRLHRAISGGVSALASRHLDILSRALAPLHGLDYIPPSLVALATRKVYMHRLVLTDAENERSIQWGSSIEAVNDLLSGVTVPDVIEEVLETVEAPL